MEEVVDTVHRLGRRMDNKPRQVILQFTEHSHRDGIWTASFKHKVCEELHIRFVEDLTREDKLARDELWPIIEKAQRAGKKAGFKGPFAFVKGKRVRAGEV